MLSAENLAKPILLLQKTFQAYMAGNNIHLHHFNTFQYCKEPNILVQNTVVQLRFGRM